MQQPPPARPWTLRAAVAVALLAVAVGVSGLVRPGGEVRTAEVPSAWDEVTLACKTTTLAVGSMDLELFSCRPTVDGIMPVGRFTEATTQWNSDVDRRPALRHDIEISPSGVVSGWADYAGGLVREP